MKFPAVLGGVWFPPGGEERASAAVVPFQVWSSCGSDVVMETCAHRIPQLPLVQAACVKADQAERRETLGLVCLIKGEKRSKYKHERFHLGDMLQR